MEPMEFLLWTLLDVCKDVGFVKGTALLPSVVDSLSKGLETPFTRRGVDERNIG